MLVPFFTYFLILRKEMRSSGQQGVTALNFLLL
jgi:hypothetical protein